MTIDSAALTAYVGALPSESSFVDGCLADSMALINGFVGATEETPGGPWSVPDEILDRCVLQTAANLYHQKAAKNGIVGFDSIEAAPVRVARDPMLDSYPLLRRFIPAGLA